MEELKNNDKNGISTKRKIGKTTYEVVVHFNENVTETMQDKLTRIMLRELRRKSDEKKMILIKKSLTSSNRKNGKIEPGVRTFSWTAYATNLRYRPYSTGRKF